MKYTDEEVKLMYNRYINSFITTFKIDNIIGFKNDVAKLVEVCENNKDNRDGWFESFFYCVFSYSTMSQEEIDETAGKEKKRIIELTHHNLQEK